MYRKGRQPQDEHVSSLTYDLKAIDECEGRHKVSWVEFAIGIQLDARIHNSEKTFLYYLSKYLRQRNEINTWYQHV